MRFVMRNDEPSIIKVIGVGGGGSNAVNHMFRKGIQGVEFAVCNTDNQALNLSPVPIRIQLGPDLTEGRGAGSKPQIGKQACLESVEEIKNFLEKDTKMVFVTAGMGGGTGTGAAPVIAKIAQELDILTVGIVSLPFSFEGNKRITQGYEGLEELKKNVDTLIIISNDKILSIHGDLAMSEAMAKADDILAVAAKGIAEIITVAGYINVDFEDVNTVMSNSGVAIMGTATAEGDDRAKKAVDLALTSPLLEDNNIFGAKHILLNITSGTKEVTMSEITQITDFVKTEAGVDSNLIWGNCFDESLGDKISVTVIATGFDRSAKDSHNSGKKETVIVVDLDDDDSRPNLSTIMEDTDRPFQYGQKTIEFDTRSRFNSNPYAIEEPYIKQHSEDRDMDVFRPSHKSAIVDYSKISDVNKFGSTKSFADLENVPAYIRKKVDLESVQHSGDDLSPRFSISEDGEPVYSDNKYLNGQSD